MRTATILPHCLPNLRRGNCAYSMPLTAGIQLIFGTSAAAAGRARIVSMAARESSTYLRLTFARSLTTIVSSAYAPGVLVIVGLGVRDG